MSTRLDIRIRADKSGPGPEPGRPWPMAGVDILGDPPKKFDFPTSWVRKEVVRGWVTIENPKPVERPSQPNPAMEKGSAAVAPEHLLSEFSPHRFVHVDYIVLDTLSHGVLRYKVVAQPDKYADNSEVDERGRITKKSRHTNTTKVSREIYDAGETRVDHFYRAVLEG